MHFLRPLVFLCLLYVAPSVFAAEVRIQKNVSYLGEGRTEKLDLYFPPNHKPGDKAPAILIIHGGGWYGGDKGAGREINIGTTLAKAGYVCASINYELAKAKREDEFTVKLERVWPRNLQDCKTAVRWMRAHSKRLGIDARNIGAIGGSAGGHLTAAVGYIDSKDGLDGDSPLYGEYSSRVKAIVPLYGPHDLVHRAKERKLDGDPNVMELCRAASPVTYLTRDDPPTLILHGTKDTTVALEQSKRLDAACEKAGIEHTLKIVEGGKHSFHLQPPGHDLRPLVISFFDKHLKPVKSK